MRQGVCAPSSDQRGIRKVPADRRHVALPGRKDGCRPRHSALTERLPESWWIRGVAAGELQAFARRPVARHRGQPHQGFVGHGRGTIIADYVVVCAGILGPP